MTYNLIHKSNGKNVVYRNTNGSVKIYSVSSGSTTTTTTTAAPSSFITLAYTAGSWSGVGTSASKYTTSSTFSPRPAGASSELLPFNFTATSDCEFYLKWSHYGVSDDNYRAQTTQILINGSPVDTDPLSFGFNGVATDIQGLISNSVEYPIWLTAGDVVTVRVYRQDTTHGPIDTYTSVSAYAVTRTSSPMTLTRQGGGSPSWSGIGTIDSKYVRAGSTEINNIGISNSIIITVKKSGTFYYTGTVSDYPDDNTSGFTLYKNGISTAQYIDEGQTVTRSVSVSVGDILEIRSGSNGPVGSNYASNISAWIV
jgi:hypothetical protein